MIGRFVIRYAVLSLACSTCTSAFPQSAHDHSPHTALGKVHFETSCKPEAQKLFDQAMLYQHSFWYRAAKQAFEGTLLTDPACAIAYWGIAQSLLLNPFGPPPPKNLEEGLAVIEKAKAMGAKPNTRTTILPESAPFTPTMIRSLTARASRPTSRRLNRSPSGTHSMTRHRFTMLSRSTLPHHQTTKLFPAAESRSSP